MSAGCSLCCWIQHTSSKPEKCLTIYDSIIYSDWFSKFASDSMSTSHHPSVKVGSEKYFAVLKVQEQHNPEPPPVTAPLRRRAVEHFFYQTDSAPATRGQKQEIVPIPSNNSWQFSTLCHTEQPQQYLLHFAHFVCCTHKTWDLTYLSVFIFSILLTFFSFWIKAVSLFFFLILPSLFIFHWSFFLCCCCNNTGTCQFFVKVFLLINGSKAVVKTVRQAEGEILMGALSSFRGEELGWNGEGFWNTEKRIMAEWRAETLPSGQAKFHPQLPECMCYHTVWLEEKKRDSLLSLIVNVCQVCRLAAEQVISECQVQVQTFTRQSGDHRRQTPSFLSL